MPRPRAMVLGFLLLFALSTILPPLAIAYRIREEGLLPPPTPEGGVPAAFTEALGFLAAVLMFSLLVVALVKLGLLRLLEAIFILAILGLSVQSSLLLACLFSFRPLALLIPALWLLVFLARRVGNELWLAAFRSLAILLTGSTAGAIISITLPLYVTLFLCVLLAAYDMYSVFRGPLRVLLEKIAPPQQGTPSLTLNPSGLLFFVTTFTGLMHVGIGDVVCYSMMVSLACLLGRRLPPIACGLAVAAAILAGMVSLRFLMDRYKLRYAPGLPLPILLALLVLLILL